VEGDEGERGEILTFVEEELKELGTYSEDKEEDGGNKSEEILMESEILGKIGIDFEDESNEEEEELDKEDGEEEQ
jgi:hypothetical protein